jgi:hypothetical protein
VPEWDITLKINYYAQNEEKAIELADALGSEIFGWDDVNEVEAPFAPTWRKDDDA